VGGNGLSVVAGTVPGGKPLVYGGGVTGAIESAGYSRYTRCRRSQKMSRRIVQRTMTTPPATPPTIAPMSGFSGVGMIMEEEDAEDITVGVRVSEI
jgi:hypothetical protein